MPRSPKLVEIIPESKYLFGVTITELLDKFLQFQNKTLILFDLETLGLNPTYEYEQITEIAASVVRGEDMSILDSFNYKVRLSSSAKELLDEPDSIQRFNWQGRQLRRGKSGFSDPNDILKMTHYHDNTAESGDEYHVIEKFYEFVRRYENPVLVAHNAPFDINFIQTRGLRCEHMLPDAEVLDTLKLSQYFFVPTIETLEKTSEAMTMLNTLRRQTKKTSHISSRLGDLATAFGINADNWHSASSDVEMMYEVMQKMIEYMRKHKVTNILANQKKAILKTTKRHRLKLHRNRKKNGKSDFK